MFLENTLVHSREQLYKSSRRDIPRGPVVKNLPSKAGNAGLIPGQGTKDPPCFGATRPQSDARGQQTVKPSHHNEDLTGGN